MKKINRNNEPDIFSLSDEDFGMNEAIQTALRTFNQFEDTFENQTDEVFSIKLAFDTKTGTEHIWLVNISKEEGSFYGTIDNLPNSINSVRLGDRIKIPREQITDWLFIKERKLFGGFTIRELRNRMSNEERIEFDKNIDFVID